MDSQNPSAEQLGRIKKVVEKLSSKKPDERDAARHELDELGASKFEVLIALLRNETDQRRKRRRAVAIGLSAYLLIVVLSVVIPTLLHHHVPTTIFSSFASMSGVLGAVFAVSAAQKNATAALAEFDDVRAVGWLALMLPLSDQSIVAPAQKKLCVLLPKLKASDSHLLDAEQRKALYRTLSLNLYNKDIQFAILKALEQIGDEKAIPVVEKLAAGEGPALTSTALRAAAIECLPALRQRAQFAKDSGVLLRGADAAVVPGSPNNLLRAASGADNVQHLGDLLHASTGDGDVVEEVQVISCVSGRNYGAQWEPAEKSGEQAVTRRSEGS